MTAQLSLVIDKETRIEANTINLMSNNRKNDLLHELPMALPVTTLEQLQQLQDALGNIEMRKNMVIWLIICVNFIYFRLIFSFELGVRLIKTVPEES